ncbi:TrkH family potassium uptake protein [Mycoplasma procyoni]|uniref:TrkH family potassium uptake protein n=1 Tax=Mycoplasma procyoni TaxID=568784 RepID=UPI00197BDFF4|nr:potassium transporter TrkG [Mycoplasma procyoni]MBN3534403.1 cation transporter [Mycoplasma procyoni]
MRKIRKRNRKTKTRKLNRFKFRDLIYFFVNLRHKFHRKVGKIWYVFLVYFLITITGSLLLWSDISQVSKNSVSYWDSLFTAASAFSDTGLVVAATGKTWTIFGQAVIAILILFGGIGVFAIKVYIINYIFGVKLGIFQRDVLALERSSNSLGEIKRVILVSVSVILVLIIFSSIALTFMFYFMDGNFEAASFVNNPKGDLNLSLRFAIFHSITAINNAGFDIIGEHSLAPYYSNHVIQIWLLGLLIIGGIGYPVVFDIYMYFVSLFKRHKNRHKFSLFSKVGLLTYFLVAFVGIALIIPSELLDKSPSSFWHSASSDPLYWGNGTKGYNYGSGFDKIFALVFAVFSTRSAGFATMDLYNLNDISVILLSVLMFIGASPSSTGGGIRSTTLALIFLNLLSRMRGRDYTHVFKRKINEKTVNQASIVLFVSLIMCFISVIVLSTSFDILGGNIPWKPIDGQRHYNSIHIFFEVSSAFGTSGLTTGLTSQLNLASKLILVSVMFFGQLGISSTVLVWGSNNHKFSKYSYLEEDLAIG